MEIFKLVGRLTTEGFDKVESALKKAEQGFKNAEQKIDRFGKGMQKAGGFMQSAGTSASVYLTAPIAALGTMAISSARDVQTATGDLQRSLGITQEAAEALADEAQELWKRGFTDSVGAAADAVALVSQNLQSLPTDQVQEVTRQAVAFEKQFGEDIAASTRTVNTLMNTFEISAGEAFDVLTYGMQNGANVSGDMLDVLNEYAPQFQQLGYDAEGFLAILIEGSEQGIFSMDKLGDAGKEALLKMTEGSDESREALEMLGFNAEEMETALASGGETANQAFTAITSALATIEDPAERARTSIALMGTPLEDISPKFADFFANVDTDLKGLEGSSAAVADSLEQSFGQRLQSVFRNLGSALEPFGNILLNLAETALPKVEQIVTNLTNWFGTLSEQQQKWIVILSLAAAALGPLLLGLGTFITVIGGAVSAIAPLIGVLTAVSAPVWLIIGAITAAVAALVYFYTTSERFREIVNKVFIVAMQLVVSTFKFYWGLVVQAFDGAVNVIMGIINTFKALFTGNWRGVWDGVLQILQGALQLLWVFLQVTILGRVMALLRGFLGLATGIFTRLASGILSRVRAMGSGLIGIFNSLRSGAVSIISNLVQSVIAFFVRMGAASAARVMAMYASIRAAFGLILGAARSQFNSIKNAIVNPINRARDLVKRAIDRIRGFFSNLRLKLPKISLPPMPHFNISGKFSLNPPSIPKIGVDWYDKGGVFYGPSIIGVGEKRPEFVGALDDLRGIVRVESGGGIGGALNRLIVEVPVWLDARQIAKAVTPEIDEELARREQRNNRNRGRA